MIFGTITCWLVSAIIVLIVLARMPHWRWRLVHYFGPSKVYDFDIGLGFFLALIWPLFLVFGVLVSLFWLVVVLGRTVFRWVDNIWLDLDKPKIKMRDEPKNGYR